MSIGGKTIFFRFMSAEFLCAVLLAPSCLAAYGDRSKEPGDSAMELPESVVLPQAPRLAGAVASQDRGSGSDLTGFQAALMDARGGDKTSAEVLSRSFDGSSSGRGMLAALGGSDADQKSRVPEDGFPGREALEAMGRQYAPVEISADVSKLPRKERQALARMVEAAKIMDSIFLRQVWNGNERLKAELMKDKTSLGAARLAYFTKNMGPWDALDNNKVFIPGAPAQKPPQADFYPADASKEEVEAWIAALPAAQQEQARGFYTTVRRGPDGRLMLVPYSQEYKAELRSAAALLNDAAALTAQPTLRAFLKARAKAFLSNDYYASEVAWMELDSTLEPTIGPYEVYQDQWFNYKAAFEANITVRDDAETAKLRQFSSRLQGLEDSLPIPEDMKNKLGGMAPIRVVNVVYNGGDANHGVQAAAFNLPNDERVIKEKGAKRVMLKNIQEAKFEKVLLPISKVVLAKGDQELVSFDAFFTHILMHELMHGLGPHEISADGRKTTVRQALQDSYSALEEAKADVSGLWAMQQLIDQDVLPKSMEKTMYSTFLASSFRTLRFGVHEAHGKGQALQLNTFLDQGAVVLNEDGTFSVDYSKIKDVVRDLVRDLMVIEGRGDLAAARAMLAERGVIRPAVQARLDLLKDVPIDIAPRYDVEGLPR
ncbi:MAG: hypothetical protein WCU88_05255 [Elusimicrobiota bacterium]|jgi:hypothetical protein